MNTEHIQQLMALPQRSSEIWQGGVFPMPIPGTEMLPDTDLPHIPIWVAVHDVKVFSADLPAPGPADPAEAVAALLAFALESEWGGYRPGYVEVVDEDLAQQLALLADAGIKVRIVKRLEAVDDALESLGQHLAEFLENGPDLPGPLEGRGVTIERVRDFAEAGAAFFAAAPWQYLTDSDLIRIEKPKPPQGMKYATVLGAGRSVFGMGFYRSIDDYIALRGHHDGKEIPNGVWQVAYDPIDELPSRDADLWLQHGLPTAPETNCPFAAWIGPEGEVKRPTARQLAFLEGLFRAFAATSETEIDSGRWQKRVRTSDGEVQYTIALPDLLKPPSHKEWMRRGFEPDRRAHERMFADMGRYFDRHPAKDVDEMNAVMNKLFTGRRFDESVTQAETPADRAQELCYDAFDTHGRRRVQLAREALEIYPDCADAYVILAEQGGTLEAEIENYSKAMKAAETALGPDAFKEYAGHFWGVTETRPYMRAREGLAQSLEQSGRLDEAANHYRALLDLNPNDNQGVRYLLMPLLLQLGRDADAARLLKAYNEGSANWTYARALLAFRLSGRSAAARRELRTALQSNPHVPELLLSGAEPPPPPHYQLGSPEEAAICAAELRSAFEETEGAMSWLALEYRQRLKDQNTKLKDRRRKERAKHKRKKR